MEPYHEILNLPGKLLPAKAWVRSSFDENVYVHPHWHDEIELLFVMEGRVRQQLNDRVFDAVQGDLIIIPGNDIHSTYTDRNIFNRILVIQFHPVLLSLYPVYKSAKKGVQDYAICSDIFPEVINLGSENGLEILKNLFLVLKELEDKRPGYEMLVNAAILQLSGLIKRNFPVGGKRAPNPKNMFKARQMLGRTFKYIDENYSRNISLVEAASASSLSVSHFCRLFKSAAGMTFIEYLSFYRINRAEALMSTTMSITQIAYDCGFDSMSSFIRSFRKFKGCTPSAYRNQSV